MNWIEEITEALKSFLTWLMDDPDQDGLPNVVEVAMVIIRVIGMFNAEPTAGQKREHARAVLKFLELCPDQELARIVSLKAHGALDGMTSEKRDAVLGATIAAYVRGERGEKPRSGKTAGA